MKLYLPCVGALLLGVFGLQLLHLKKYEPTIRSFADVQVQTGFMHYEKSGGRLAPAPIFNGKLLSCDASFDGAGDSCDGRLHTLREGSELTVSYVELPTERGPVRVALAIAVRGGEKYSTTPEKIIDDWKKSSRESLWQAPLEILFLLVFIPAMISERMRRWM